MKITDDYKAKIKLWARNPQVAPDLAPKNMPQFRSQGFSSHANMNAWKKSMLREFAKLAPGPE
jgi:hypothetical protein